MMRLRKYGPRAALAAIPVAALLVGSATLPTRRCLVTPGEVFVPAVGARQRAPGDSGRAFMMDRTEVTVAQFEAFVDRTGYRTQVERLGYSAAFEPTSSSHFWVVKKGADWTHPEGPNMPAASPGEPVTQVTYNDAVAYANWKGRDLPTDAEWERAAKGGDPAESTSLKWAYRQDGTPIANTWQGIFPYSDSGQDGFKGVAPVGCFAANGFGLFDMVGNVWELTRSPGNQAVLKGGSYLCSFNGCANFRPSGEARQDSAFGAPHVGFRTIRRI